MRLVGLILWLLCLSVVICVMFLLVRCSVCVSRLLVRFLCLVDDGIIE